MGYSLAQQKSSWYFNLVTWPAVLCLADLGGWQPVGTKLWHHLEDPDMNPIDWDGSYTVNEGQKITDDDAKALADGLENLLDCTIGLPIAKLLDKSAKEWESAEELKGLLERRLGFPIADPFVREALELLQSEGSRSGLRASCFLLP